MKNILFFSPPFFNYPSIIKVGLERVFDKVTYFNTIPSTTLFKASWYIETYFSHSACRKNLQNKLFRAIRKEIEHENEKYDYILVIKGSCIPEEFYVFLKQKYPYAKYIQYIWDDICNDLYALETFKYFDSILSYNAKDCEKYNLKFRPFFYVEEYLSCEKERKYDISCMMSFSEDRINFLHKFLTSCTDTMRIYILIKASFLLKIIYHSKIADLMKYISSQGVSYSEMMSILRTSRCQVDLQHPRQEGLTTRAFEALATCTKLITTNHNVIEYDFYNPDNIMVISRDNPSFDAEWLKKPYKMVSEEVMKRYSLTTFINDIIYG